MNTKEQIQKAMNCKTADELIALAKADGVELSREEAETFLAQMKTKELTAEELEKVAGGWSWIRGLMGIMGFRSLSDDSQDELCKTDLPVRISAPRR